MYCKWNVTFYSSHQQIYFCWPSPHGLHLNVLHVHPSPALTLPPDVDLGPKCSQVVGLFGKFPELPDRCARNDSWPQRFDVDLKWSVPACRGVELFRLQRLSYAFQKNRNCVWIRKPDWLLSLQMVLWRKLGCWQSCQCLRPTWHRTWRGMHLHSRS